jgi:hypothetical protein
MLSRGLSDRQLAGLDLHHQLAFEFGFEPSFDSFSHYQYPAPHPPAEKIAGRSGLWKMPQLWKSRKVAFGNILLLISTSCLESLRTKRFGFPTFTTAPAATDIPHRFRLSGR